MKQGREGAMKIGRTTVLLVLMTVFSHALGADGWDGKWSGDITVDKAKSEPSCSDGTVNIKVENGSIKGLATMGGNSTSVSGKVVSGEAALLDMPEWKFSAVMLAKQEENLTATVRGRKCTSSWRLQREQ
jgi:hypothetical protein